MTKKSSYFSHIVLLESLWASLSIVIVVVLHKIIDMVIMSKIDDEKSLDYIYELYFSFEYYVFIILLIILLIVGSFYIQKRGFDKYREYFVSGLDYLSGENSEIIPFHESLSDERISFINIRKHYDEMEKEYELAFREKTDLLTYLAHDIKTPLSNLLGYASLLNDEEELTKEQQKKFKKVIYENAKFLNSLTEDFFSYLKFNLNEIPLNISEVNLELFFKQWGEERKLTLDENSISIDFIGTSRKKIKTDPELLLRVMDNLLSNARKYSKSGTLINVTVKNTEDTLIIKMINEVEKGLNIDFRTMQMKFRRGDLSRNRVVNSGSGLGLTIVNDIVKHLNGNFNIYEYESKVCAEVIFKIQ